jgi:hypothetical protein
MGHDLPHSCALCASAGRRCCFSRLVRAERHKPWRSTRLFSLVFRLVCFGVGFGLSLVYSTSTLLPPFLHRCDPRVVFLLFLDPTRCWFFRSMPTPTWDRRFSCVGLALAAAMASTYCPRVFGVLLFRPRQPRLGGNGYSSWARSRSTLFPGRAHCTQSMHRGGSHPFLGDGARNPGALLL